MFIEYLKYSYGTYLYTVGYFIGLIFYIRHLIVYYNNKKSDKSRTIKFIHIFLFIPLLFGSCYFIYLDTNNFKDISKGYKEFNGVYIGVVDLNNSDGSRRHIEYEYKFKDNEGNILVVRNSFVIYNRFKDLEPLETYNVQYFNEDLIREIELLE